MVEGAVLVTAWLLVSVVALLIIFLNLRDP